MKTNLTPGQQNALARITKRGYAVSCFFGTGYSVGDGPRLQHRTILALVQKGYLDLHAVPPGHRVGAYTNGLKVSEHIVTPKPDEWVIVAERDSGVAIVRDGMATGREAALVRAELERRLDEDDTVNFLLLTRQQADELLAEAQVQR